MDLYLNLLTSEEILAIQNICLDTVDYYRGGLFSFKDTRESVDVIIGVSCQAGATDEGWRIYVETITEKRDEIRAEIAKLTNELDILDPNRELRDRVRNDQPLPDDYLENARELPELEEFKRSLDNLSSLTDRKEGIERRLRGMLLNMEKEHNAEARLHYENERRRLEEVSNQLEKTQNYLTRVCLGSSDVECLVFQIQQLERYLKHLEDEINGNMPQDDNVFYCSSVLGRYVKHRKRGKVFLFIQEIESYANLRGRGRVEVLMEVFVHEMMHAYLNRENRKNSILGHMDVIEEPMAEYGMLCFLEKYTRGKRFKSQFFQNNSPLLPNFFDNVCNDVRDKLRSPRIQYYGFGYALFDVRRYSNPLTLLNMYAVVNRIVYLEPKLYNAYYRAVTDSSIANPTFWSKCESILKYLIKALNTYRLDESYSYFFNSKSLKHNNELARAVFECYVNLMNPATLAGLEKDFDNNNTALWGRTKSFIERTALNNTNQHKYDAVNPIRFTDANTGLTTEILVKLEWKSGQDSDTYRLITTMLRHGRRVCLL